MKARRIVLLFSLLLVVFSASHVLFMGAVGWGISYLFTVPGYLALPTLGLAVFLYARANQKARSARGWKRKLWLFFVALGIMTIGGLMKGNMLRAIVDDFWINSYFLLFVIIGRYDEAWKDLEKPLIVIFWFLFLLTVWGLSLRRPLLNEAEELVFLDLAQDRPAINTAGYEFHRTLGFWPLVFLLGCFKRERLPWRALALVSLIAFLFLTMIFQKRAPFVRAMLYALAPLLISFGAMRHKRLLKSLGVLSCFAVALVFIGTSDAYKNLILRIREEAPLWESARLIEARAMIKDLRGPEYIVGRGLGGHYLPPPDWDAGVSAINDQGDLGRTSLHIGMLVPILKGGILFWLITYSLYWPVLRLQRRGWYESPLNMCAIVIIPIYFASQFIEGGASRGNVFDALLIGLAVGRLGTIVPSRLDSASLRVEGR